MNNGKMMPTEAWDHFIKDKVETFNRVLGIKAAEYAGNEDRMHNFNVAFEMSPHYKTREDAIYGMAVKHWISILDILQGLRFGKKYPEAFIREKFTDWQNYMILMEASILHNQGQLEEDLPF